MLVMEKSYRIFIPCGQRNYSLEEYEIFMEKWCRGDCNDEVMNLTIDDFPSKEFPLILQRDGICYEMHEIWNKNIEKIAVMNMPLGKIAQKRRFASGIRSGKLLYLCPNKVMEYLERILHDYERQELDVGREYWLEDAIV